MFVLYTENYENGLKRNNNVMTIGDIHDFDLG